VPIERALALVRERYELCAAGGTADGRARENFKLTTADRRGLRPQDREPGREPSRDHFQTRHSSISRRPDPAFLVPGTARPHGALTFVSSMRVSSGRRGYSRISGKLLANAPDHNAKAACGWIGARLTAAAWPGSEHPREAPIVNRAQSSHRRPLAL